MRISDWSSDVCSSDLQVIADLQLGGDHHLGARSDEALLQRRGHRDHLVDRSGLEDCRGGPVVADGDDLARLVVHAEVGQGERSEEHTSELQSLMRISYAVFCLKKKNQTIHPKNLLEADKQHRTN